MKPVNDVNSEPSVTTPAANSSEKDLSKSGTENMSTTLSLSLREEVAVAAILTSLMAGKIRLTPELRHVLCDNLGVTLTPPEGSEAVNGD